MLTSASAAGTLAVAPSVPVVEVETFLAEPLPLSPEWFRSAYGRVLAMTSSPLLVLPPSDPVASGPLRARLERAGVPCDAPGVDVDRAAAAAWSTRAAVDGAGAVGCGFPFVVVVGEREPKDRGLPFFSKSGRWLLRALRCLGYDELGVLLVNATSSRVRTRNPGLAALREALEGAGAPWLALGTIAREHLVEAGIEHHAAPHPAWHIRFHYSELPEGYAARLKAAGLPEGPGAPTAAETVPVAQAPPLPEPFDVATAENYHEGSPASIKARQKINPEKCERARRLFVVGEAASVAEACAKAGLPPKHLDDLRVVARDQAWETERERHREDVRRKVYEDAAVAESRAVGNARRLAWAAANLALDKVVDRLKASDARPTAKDAESLTRSALLLAGHATPAADADLEKFRSLPLPELASRLAEASARLVGVPGAKKEKA